ncbi:MAG: ATP-binding cassette domain-containing protein [Gammaproteobacteria bacterium]|nr:ATP-binding cassette domain-containing protein [Gammaproteobacteria bacterium]MYD75989.1 ATP-binding cassette domain-containing protein [Gammaproteobacteria bacterium]MYJ52871.1 ATP-binding cassette domain-containing protein [Gammaproteobacteria bacterium]
MTALLEVDNVTVEFSLRGGPVPGSPSRDRFAALEGVSLELAERETLGIVGESGSGKTTLVRAIVGMVPIQKGRIVWKGSDLSGTDPDSRRRIRKDMSMIFQNPLASLNPRMTIGQIIAEPCQVHEPHASRAEIRRRVAETMERVGLAPALVNRYPHEFSGGQCQRVGIARALIGRPKLIICDEPVAALDVSIRAQIVNLLKQLQDEFGISLIMISHDLSVIRHVSHRIMVMYLGHVMEMLPSGHLLQNSCHPYTRALIESVPIPDPSIQKAREMRTIKGELPSMRNPPSGCRFTTRCPIARDRCGDSRPALLEAGPGHWLACPYCDPPPGLKTG